MATPTSSSGTQQIDRLSESAHAAVDRAAQTAAQMAERVGAKGEELFAMRDDYVEAARDYVKQNPIMAIGIALAAGYLFGKISSWR